MTTFEDFNKHFFEGKNMPMSFFNKTIIIPIGNQKLAKIEISISNTHGQYEGYLVSIIHNQNGELDSEYFPFKSYLSIEGKSTESLKIIEHCGIDWYISKPTKESVKSMANKIWEWIRLHV